MSRKTSDHRSITVEKRFVCKPLDSYSEIMCFLENPPPWRTLCKELTPHSDSVIRNIDINAHSIRSIDRPENFCHIDPDLEDVKRHDSKSLPKTLVCHDMANGYHDDCLLEGSSNSEAYIFYNWAAIDIFCYFSHHLITIPPVGWINIGHAHGVKVIGTIITEWAEGITFWEQILTSELQYQNFASAMVAIAKTLKFDGFLLNIENKISKPEMLLQFVRYFHRLLHEELPHGTLLWYDSVTIQGNLNWQNKLDDKNMAFFEACDGLFTNYSWSKEDITSSVTLAAGRLTDLYIGIDVWGRNFFGGGQFNIQEAVKVVHAEGCSIALFAPAWTHEALTSEKGDNNYVAMAEELRGYHKFLLRDRALWGSIWPYLNTKLPCHIPFQTSFCRGQGSKRFLYGEVLSPSPWFNLRHQQYQPNSAHGSHGYLLTSIENLSKVQREVHYKDKKGIIRIRASFQQSRHELHAINKDASMPYNTSITSIDEPESSAESVLRSDDAMSDDSKKAVKTKAKALKTKNKQKSIKIADDEEGNKPSVEDTQQVEEDNAASSSVPSHRTSMVQMSVNLHLGGADKSRFGLAFVRDERECLELYLHDGFAGGSCLKVNPSDKLCPEHRTIRLFHCDFRCEQGLIFCVVTKNMRQYPDQTLNVKLFMKNAADQELTVVLTGRDLAQTVQLDGSSTGIKYMYPLRTSSEPVLRDLRTYLLLSQPGFYVPIDNLFGWTVRYYEINVPGSRITSVNLRTGVPQGGILFGHFGICHKSINKSWRKSFSTIVENTIANTAENSGDATQTYRDRCVAQ